MNHAQKIKKLLDDRGWSASELARRAGLSQRSVAYIIKGAREPGVRTARLIANALGVGVDWLFDDAADWPPPRAGSDTRVIPDALLIEEVLQRRVGAFAILPGFLMHLEDDLRALVEVYDQAAPPSGREAIEKIRSYIERKTFLLAALAPWRELPRLLRQTPKLSTVFPVLRRIDELNRQVEDLAASLRLPRTEADQIIQMNLSVEDALRTILEVLVLTPEEADFASPQSKEPGKRQKARVRRLLSGYKNRTDSEAKTKRSASSKER